MLYALLSSFLQISLQSFDGTVFPKFVSWFHYFCFHFPFYVVVCFLAHQELLLN